MKKSVFLFFLIACGWQGCTYETLPAPAFSCEDGVSFSADIQPIIETKCALDGCHNGSSSLPNWLVFDNVKEKSEKIKEFTGSRYMPAVGSLTQSQIDAIACWVDNGALQN